MGTATRMWSVDTYVNASRPTTNYFSAHRLGLKKWDADDAQYAYITFSKPFPFGAKIKRATLTLQTYAMAEGGSHSLNLSRVTQSMTYGRVTYNTRPDVSTADQITVTKTGALPGGQEWEFDVTSHLQKVSDGEAWWGWRVTTGDVPQRWLYAEETSSQSVEGPKLTIEWADNPDEPQSLSPDEGVVGTHKPALSFEYVDVAGDTTLSRAIIQTSNTTSFAVPSWDSGELKDLKGPTIYLSGTTFPGATEGQRVYYRIKVADGDNLWSKWSSVAWFVYRPQTTVTPTSFNPDNPRFGDSTPDLSWNAPGQVAYHVTIARTANPGRILYNTGKVTSTNNVIGIPPKVLRWDDTNYRVIIRVWDKYNRVSIANSLAYAVGKYDVHLDIDDLTPVTIYSVTPHRSGPYIDLEWDRSTSADAWEIVRQDRTADAEKIVVDRVIYADSLQSNGRHRYRDRTAPPNTPLRYIIRPVVDGKRGGGTPTDWITHDLPGIWLIDDTYTLFIAGDAEGTWTLPESETAHDILGATHPTIVREQHKGYQAEVEGLLIDERRFQPTRDAQTKRDIFLKMKKKTRNARLVAGDLNLPVDLTKMNVHPTPHKGRRYPVTFTAYQNDEIWWERL